ncbi:MAG: adenylate/guanylate cyclase domain-containing protein, partial [Tepidiformaceae bacterium]
EMDGYTLLEHRARDSRLREIPFIVISGVEEMASIVRCIGLGAEDYLPKPFDAVLLRARISASLEKKRLRDQERELLATVTRQAGELAAWNRELSTRVDEKVREVERLSRMERFLAPQIAQVIAEGGEELLKSHRREITVLFCDLRGFTAFAETNEPEDVMAVLREMHEAIGPLIFEFEGTLAQFTGDGMMVFFNDPIPCEDPAWRAAQLGLGMRQSVGELSNNWRRRGHALELGVGIAIGHATCGQIGFEGRFEYTAIGTVTNLAARLCGEAKGGQVLVSERVSTMLEDRVAAERIGDLTLKGFARPVSAYNLLNLRPVNDRE